MLAKYLGGGAKFSLRGILTWAGGLLPPTTQPPIHRVRIWSAYSFVGGRNKYRAGFDIRGVVQIPLWSRKGHTQGPSKERHPHLMVSENYQQKSPWSVFVGRGCMFGIFGTFFFPWETSLTKINSLSGQISPSSQF